MCDTDLHTEHSIGGYIVCNISPHTDVLKNTLYKNIAAKLDIAHYEYVFILAQGF